MHRPHPRRAISLPLVPKLHLGMPCGRSFTSRGGDVGGRERAGRPPRGHPRLAHPPTPACPLLRLGGQYNCPPKAFPSGTWERVKEPPPFLHGQHNRHPPVALHPLVLRKISRLPFQPFLKHPHQPIHRLTLRRRRHPPLPRANASKPKTFISTGAQVERWAERSNGVRKQGVSLGF